MLKTTLSPKGERQRGSSVGRYSVAVITTIIAFILTRSIWWLIEPHLYPLFLAAVMVSSWYGGIGPGLAAIALTVVVRIYFFIPPFYALTVDRIGAIGGLAQFVLVALLLVFLNTRLRSTQQQGERHAREALHNYDRLRQSEERYGLLLEGVTDYAIFMLDANGFITTWNVGAERILGYSEAEIIGQPFSHLFPSEAIAQGLPERVLNTAITEGFSRENCWHVRKNSSPFWAHCFITPLRDEAGNLRGFSKIMQDITERKQAEEEREELLRRERAARAEAEAANRTKDDFLAVVSHELRTPMTAIVGWAGMLRTGMLDEANAVMAMETIERNANSQMQLIEDLLDISRIVRGEISLNFGRVDLVKVIDSAIEVIQPTAQAKNLQLEWIEPSDRSKFLVRGDSERLQQVILNLLSNAVKFTPQGGNVEVLLSATDSGTQEERLSFARIQVSDTGIGISAEFLPHVFDRFRQADSTSARSNKGLGLGLAISCHLVELHGGTISAASPGLGQGSSFSVTLPTIEGVEEIGETEGSGNFKEEFTISLTGLQVLVVDDDADARQWISTVLEESGAEAIALGSVSEALKALERQRPDVLVSDIGMPGEDGYALIRKIRELEPMGRRIPAVALTAYARAEDYQKALAEGFQLHVAKPIRSAELVAVVAGLARRDR
ncbi:MAG: ATP-binding protein [Hydrococcus sp. Prado102]|nr:ATP-binding protein [Hydrococcus sp. Prado102]